MRLSILAAKLGVKAVLIAFDLANVFTGRAFCGVGVAADVFVEKSIAFAIGATGKDDDGVSMLDE